MTWDKKIPCLPEQNNLQMQSAIWVIDAACSAQTSLSELEGEKIAAAEKLRSPKCKDKATQPSTASRELTGVQSSI